MYQTGEYCFRTGGINVLCASSAFSCRGRAGNLPTYVRKLACMRTETSIRLHAFFGRRRCLHRQRRCFHKQRRCLYKQRRCFEPSPLSAQEFPRMPPSFRPGGRKNAPARKAQNKGGQARWPARPCPPGGLSLLADDVLDEQVAADDLQQHARDADAEVLERRMQAARPCPFEARARQLVEQDHGQQEPQRHRAETPGRPSCRRRQQHGLHQDGGQHGRRRHAEKPRIEQGRRDRRQQSHFPAILVRADQREEINRQPRGPALRRQMEQLGQGNVARNEQQRGKVRPGAAKRQ